MWFCTNLKEEPMVMHTKFKSSLIDIGSQTLDWNSWRNWFWQDFATFTWLTLSRNGWQRSFMIMSPIFNDLNSLGFYICDIVERETNRCPHSTRTKKFFFIFFIEVFFHFLNWTCGKICFKIYLFLYWIILFFFRL